MSATSEIAQILYDRLNEEKDFEVSVGTCCALARMLVYVDKHFPDGPLSSHLRKIASALDKGDKREW